MKYIKRFEDINTPQIGDYILAKLSNDNKDEIVIKINNFLNNNIGRIIDMSTNNSYVVQYENIPEQIFRIFNHTKNNENDIQYKNYRYINLKNILHFSNKPFDIIIAKNSKIYNL
jgi:hypothetical protein